MPTAYLISYSTEAMQNHGLVGRGRYDLARKGVPYNAHRLPTIRCANLTPPPQQICDYYSGIHRLVQQWVIQDPQARQAIDNGVRDILNTFAKGHKRVFRKTCCLGGTHRSVAVAELIGQQLKDLGYKVVIMHPHRPYRAGDPPPSEPSAATASATIHHHSNHSPLVHRRLHHHKHHPHHHPNRHHQHRHGQFVG